MSEVKEKRNKIEQEPLNIETTATLVISRTHIFIRDILFNKKKWCIPRAM